MLIAMVLEAQLSVVSLPSYNAKREWKRENIV